MPLAIRADAFELAYGEWAGGGSTGGKSPGRRPIFLGVGGPGGGGQIAVFCRERGCRYYMLYTNVQIKRFFRSEVAQKWGLEFRVAGGLERVVRGGQKWGLDFGLWSSGCGMRIGKK